MKKPNAALIIMKHLVTALLLAPLAALGAADAPAKQPNIIVILADDLGYADLGCQGSKEVVTPQIDSIAADGVRFTAGYVSAPQCCPSRAGLVTGRYQNRFGFEANWGPRPVGAPVGLPAGERTIADRLKAAGYVTGMVGKWHLGESEAMRPYNRGFDETFWHPNGGVLFPDKKTGFISNLYRGAEPVQEKAYSTDAFGREACAFIDRHQRESFFLYLAFIPPHWPMEAKPEHLTRFNHIPDLHRRSMLGMMASLDENVGRVLDKLRETKLEENTLIFFLSDNGGPTGRARPQPDADFEYGQNTSKNDPCRGVKGDLLEGGIRVPFLVQWKGRIPAGKTYDQPVISLDILPTALAAAGVEPQSGWQLDGANLLPFLTGEKPGTPHSTLCWRFRFPPAQPAQHRWAIRQGDWKLVKNGHEPVALYDLGSNIGETRNLAAGQPDRVTAMKAAFDQWNAQNKEPLWTDAPATPVAPHAANAPKPAHIPNHAATARLHVVNGDFSDLSGMKMGRDGWCGGLPNGWRGTDNTYAVHTTKGATPPTCNPSTLGLLRQNVGVLEKASDVSLTFDVSEPWNAGVTLNAAILDGDFVPLASGDFQAGAKQQLAATNVPAGTHIVLAFQAGKSTPGLDNVSVSAQPVTDAAPAAPRVESESRVTVACYYFGNYHPGDPRNAKAKGPDWSEWELVKAARPRFPGHQQPKVPLWGYTDESDPKVMEQKIDAAADHGIDAFIFDWYYYNDGPYLDRPIDIGFLKARNNARLKFAFMWANHDWEEIQPYRRGTPSTLLHPGEVTPENFEKICDHLIQDYFLHPSYWKIDGKPYFSFYDLTKLLQNFGSVEATRAALDRFRAKTKAAGLPGLHLNAVVWGTPVLPAEKAPADPAKLVKDLGFDSVTSYVWIHHVALPRMQTDYNEVRDNYFGYWFAAERKFSVPYYPNVTMGWDSSPRADQSQPYGNFGYPFTNTIDGNTPDRFQEAMAMTKRRLLATPGGPRILNINCWNEWTEGSYLEPDQRNGMKYLEAVREVFGPTPTMK